MARRQRLAMTVVVSLTFGSLPAFPGAAAAADTLSESGARLSAVSVSAGAQDIRRSVDLGGDQPIASYVTARSPAGAMLMRTRQGYWLPWSGRTEELSDTGASAKDGKLEFKILKEDLAAASLPITVSIGYRTAAGVKFGTFDITAK